MQETELVKGARRGEEAAWDEIMRLHQEPMFRLAYLLLGEAEEAQDATQDALIRAHRYLAHFDSQRELRPWLLSIVANLSRNRKRSLGRYWNAVQRWAKERSETDAINTATAVEDPDLWSAMKSLSDMDREIIYLRYFMELSVKECAESLEIAEGTVKSRTSRALARIEDLLQGEEG